MWVDVVGTDGISTGLGTEDGVDRWSYSQEAM